MPKKVGIEQWKKKRRQQNLEMKSDRYYIFCEGEKTEPNYFEGFKHLIEDHPAYHNMILIEIQPCGKETLRVLDAAEKYVEDQKISKGQVWCVYDKDSFPSEHFNGVEERIRILNQGSSDLQYHAAWSNECIEFWFILHFENYTSNNSRSEYTKFLNKKFYEYNLGKYQKNSKDIFNILMNKGNPKLAIRYAQAIISDSQEKSPSEIAPGTKVYQLVQELAKYLPEQEKQRFF